VTHLAGGVPAGAWGSVPQAGPDPGRPGPARCDAVPVPGGPRRHRFTSCRSAAARRPARDPGETPSVPHVPAGTYARTAPVVPRGLRGGCGRWAHRGTTGRGACQPPALTPREPRPCHIVPVPGPAEW